MVVRDVVANAFRRLGMVGAIVRASALIFGAIAGGVIVHRLDANPSASSEQAQDSESANETQKTGDKSQGHANKQKQNNSNGQKHSSQNNSSNAKDAEDKDA